jgi:hypothetical protein
VFPLNLYARVRISLMHIAHETAGAARTRSSLRPLVSRANDLQTSGACRRENNESHLVVPANAGTHTARSFVLANEVDAFFSD